jgi:phospholipid transport system substrate-binding protein
MERRFLTAVLLVLIGTAPVAAGEPTERLRTFFDRANRVILAPESDGGVDERVSAVRALVNELFDFDGAAALALGRHWDTLPPPARAAFTRLYADVIERAYLAWVGGKARVGEGGVSLRWLEETVEGDAATVTSVLLTRTGAELPIDYRMVRRADDWLVRDVVVDGVGLAANYHVQFERVLQLGSYDDLVARLREKAGPVARAEAIAASASSVRAMAAAPPPLGPPAPIAHETPTAAASVPAPSRIVVADLRDAAGAVATDAPPSTLAQAGPTPRVNAAPSAPPATARPDAAARSTRVAVAAPARQFWVQVGAFRTADAAARLVERLHRHAVIIAIGREPHLPLARVLVGPFAERAAAASAMRALQASGIAAFIADR